MSGPPPAVAEIRYAVRRSLSDLAPGAVVLVACSGGADSLALAAATAFEAPRLGLGAGAVVVDHGWFDGSAQVAAAAATTCAELGLSPVVVARAGESGGAHDPADGGPEASARRMRYAALRRVADEHRASAVLLGHTLDDQAETVLLGLARGSGARSTAGMAAVRGLWRRPMLAVTRASTHELCRVAGLMVWHDPANDDDAYTRARLRRTLRELGEALGPGLAANLARTAELAREDADALDALAAEQLSRLSPPRPSDPHHGERDGSAVDCAELAVLVPAVRRRVLLAVLRRAGCPPSATGRRHVLAVDALVTSWHGQGPVHLPGGVVARRRCGTLEVRRGADADQGSVARTDRDCQE